MFTGIVTALGTVRGIAPLGSGDDMRLVIAAPWPDTASIAIGASIACSGCCLTAIEVGADWFAADASAETLAQDHARHLAGRHAGQPGALAAGRRRTRRPHRLGPCRRRRRGAVAPTRNTARPAGVSASPLHLARFIAAKGSVAVDGVSLTVNEVADDTFGVNIIPHTAAVTSFGSLRPGDPVNIEIDMLARYVARLAEFQ